MTTEEKTLLAVLTAAAVLVSAALGGALGWPMWSWLLLAVPLLGVLGLMARNIQRRVRPDWLREGYVAAPVQEVEQQPQDQQIPVADVTLPSAADGYAFHFSATVYWSPMGGSALQHANLAGLAADAVVSRARAITVTEQPSQVDAVALCSGTPPVACTPGPTRSSSRCPKPTRRGYAGFRMRARTRTSGSASSTMSAASGPTSPMTC
jgi:hypothetical protein